jgi:hypothetical protein
VVEWVKQLSPIGKRAVLEALIPELDRFEVVVDYGAEQSIDRDSVSEEERERLVDKLLYGA